MNRMEALFELSALLDESPERVAKLLLALLGPKYSQIAQTDSECVLPVTCSYSTIQRVK